VYYSYIIFLIYGTQTLVEKLLLILEPSSLIESKKGISMSSLDVTVELSEDDKFVEEVVAQFDNENRLSTTGFYKYLNKAIKLIQHGGKIRDFCDLLDKSVNKHMDNLNTKLRPKQNTTIATNSADTTTLITFNKDEKAKLRRNHRDKALTSIKAIGSKVLDFLKALVEGQYVGTPDYIDLQLYQPEMIDEIKAFREWVQENASSLQNSLIMESVYLEVLSNTKIGLLSKKDHIVPLIEGFLEVDEDIWVENDIENNVKTYLKDKKSNFTPNQEQYFAGFVQYVKDNKTSVDNKSSVEPANPEKRQKTITQRLSDVYKDLNKKRNPTKKRKIHATLSAAVEEVVLVSDNEAEDARNETSSEVSENETDGPTKASKNSKDNRSKAKPIRVLESTPNLSTGSTNILQDDSRREKTNDEEEKSDGSRRKISKANPLSASNNEGVPESTPKNREIGSGEVSEVSNGPTTRKKAIIKNKEKAQSIRREDDVGEDDDEAMEITQEEKNSGANLPTSSLEEDVGEVLESTRLKKREEFQD